MRLLTILLRGRAGAVRRRPPVPAGGYFRIVDDAFRAGRVRMVKAGAGWRFGEADLDTVEP